MKKYRFRNIIMWFIDNIQDRKVLKPMLEGGLCNKLFSLMSACEIACKNNYKILEPEFGWRSKVLFSEIYDINYFNQTMEELTGIKNIMISSRQKVSEKEIQLRRLPLWKYSENNLRTLRKKNIIYQNSMMVYMLKSLKLVKQFENMVIENLPNSLAVQFRIESDWVKYSKHKTVDQDETILINPDMLIDMLIEFNSTNRIFFTTGENQQYVKNMLKERGIESSFFYDESLEYEMNAAINFEILSQSNKFIGLSRSTFSNLITLKRQLLLNNDENYIYNYGKSINIRTDFGLYPNAFDSISKKPQILINKSNC